MIKWTTPTIQINFEDNVLDGYKQIVVSFKSTYQVLNITDEDLTIEDNSISLTLTQQQSSILGDNTSVQVNVYYNNGTRAATNIMQVDFGKNLLQQTMEIDNG